MSINHIKIKKVEKIKISAFSKIYIKLYYIKFNVFIINLYLLKEKE